MSTNRESIISGFAALRTVTDPRGHDLIGVLEDEMLWLHDSILRVVGETTPADNVVAFPDRYGHPGHSVRVDIDPRHKWRVDGGDQ